VLVGASPAGAVVLTLVMINPKARGCEKYDVGLRSRYGKQGEKRTPLALIPAGEVISFVYDSGGAAGHGSRKSRKRRAGMGKTRRRSQTTNISRTRASPVT
jgi:hypothetical protein